MLEKKKSIKDKDPYSCNIQGKNKFVKFYFISPNHSRGKKELKRELNKTPKTLTNCLNLNPNNILTETENEIRTKRIKEKFDSFNLFLQRTNKKISKPFTTQATLQKEKKSKMINDLEIEKLFNKIKKGSRNNSKDIINKPIQTYGNKENYSFKTKIIKNLNNELIFNNNNNKRNITRIIDHMRNNLYNNMNKTIYNKKINNKNKYFDNFQKFSILSLRRKNKDLEYDGFIDDVEKIKSKSRNKWKIDFSTLNGQFS